MLTAQLLPPWLRLTPLIFSACFLPLVLPQNCGHQASGQLCPDGSSCCSQYGFCGSSSAFCGDGCQSQCTSPSPSPSPSFHLNSSINISSIMTSAVFDEFMFNHNDPNDSSCPPNNFYNVSALLVAAAAFSGFGTTGSTTTAKRELAAFFANVAVTTYGGCHVDAVHQEVHCTKTSEWGCAAGKKYFGRGPIQLTGNANYGLAGEAIGFDGINDPDFVAKDAVVSFKTAIWYWMTVGWNSTCHGAITGGQGSPEVFNTTVDIVWGSSVDSDNMHNLIESYDKYCGILGVDLNIGLPSSPGEAPVPSFTPNYTSAIARHRQAENRDCVGALCSMASKVIALGVTSLSAFAVTAVVLAYALRHCKRRRNHSELERKVLAKTPNFKFPYHILATATKGFTTVVGKGAFGVVYKGVLPDGVNIAVKVLNESLDSDDQQFLTEIDTVGNLHHINVVRLMGFCFKKSKRLLVYEYISKGSLDKFLFGEDQSLTLSWDQRYGIALGIARGMSYLHEECRHRIIHCDLKPHNVLVDEAFVAKVSDFGLAKLMLRDESKLLTQMRGTPGYVAPEFWTFHRGPLSTKFDVYSFGILALELVSGRKSFRADVPSAEMFLPDWAFQELHAPLRLIDSRIVDTADLEKVHTLVLVAIWCIQEDPSHRPSMVDVVRYLEGTTHVPLNPPQPFKDHFLSNTVDSGATSGKVSDMINDVV